MTRERRRRSEAERAELVDRWRGSGLSAEVFAAKHGVGVSTLYQWAQRRAAPSHAVAFTQLHVSDGVAKVAGSVRLELPSGARLELDGPVDAHMLATLVKLAAAC